MCVLISHGPLGSLGKLEVVDVDSLLLTALKSAGLHS